MTDIAASRRNVQIEETDFRSAVSEAVFQKTGGSINFINDRQLFYYNFNLNGTYAGAAGQTGLEGFMISVFNFEIFSIGVNNTVQGSSGTTTIDIHLIDGGGTDQGTIFTVKPSVTTTATNNAYAVRRFLPSVSDVVTATGITLPTLITTSFDAGDAFRFDVDTAMLSAQNFSITIGYRPR
jgi:hypothetical protein